MSESLPLTGCFAGMVEIELYKLVAHAAGHDVAAGVDVGHDGVAVVFERDRAGDVVELDGLERLVEAGIANVDRRLFAPLGAGPVCRVQFSPRQRTSLAPVIPLGSGLRGGHGGGAYCKSGKHGYAHQVSPRDENGQKPRRILFHRHGRLEMGTSRSGLAAGAGLCGFRNGAGRWRIHNRT